MSEVCLITCGSVMAVLMCVFAPNVFGQGLGRKRPWPFRKEQSRHLPGVKNGKPQETILRVVEEGVEPIGLPSLRYIAYIAI